MRSPVERASSMASLEVAMAPTSSPASCWPRATTGRARVNVYGEPTSRASAMASRRYFTPRSTSPTMSFTWPAQR